MSATTSIEWTDATWTPVRARLDRLAQYPSVVLPADRIGWHCEHVSEGCRNCYAETMNKRLGTGLDYKPGNLAPRGPVEMFLDEKLLLAPLKWRKPKRIFVCSMTDLFADFVPDAFIDRIFAVMALCPRHSFQVLTKRPERMRAYLTKTERFGPQQIGAGDDIADAALDIDAGRWMSGDVSFELPLPNVWLGVSVEDQAAADARIPLLLSTPAAVRFLSCEPLLGPVDLTDLTVAMPTGPEHWNALDRVEAHHAADEGACGGWLDWVIAGGESGPGARPMHPDWARGLRDQCAAAGVPFLFKQWGQFAPLTSAHPVTDLLSSNANVAWPDGSFGAGVPSCRGGPGQQMYRATKKLAGRLLDGVQHDGMPA